MPIEVYVEHTAKRAVAGAIEWPGWCRVGRDEASALEALLAYGPRYAAALAGQHGFAPPPSLGDLAVVERMAGDSSTDFGVPGLAPGADSRQIGADLARLQGILRACWGALERSAQAAEGAELRLGPRGGGRSLTGILEHVLGAEQSYLRRIAYRPPAQEGADLRGYAAQMREAACEALAEAAAGNLPERGPRGGAMWPPRYYVRRSAWHVLDHAWEIADRVIRP
jgi:hypothetical protein